MSTETIIVLVVLAFLLGSLPTWPYSREWGYGPSSILTVLGVLLLLWVFFGNSDARHFRGSGSDYSRPAAHGDGDIKGAAQEVGDGLRDAGQDLKRSVHDATQ
jgi:hypothetical protein